MITESTLDRRKATRIALGMSVEELALALGVDQSTLFRWEEGLMGIHPLRDEQWRKLLRRIERRRTRRC